MEIWLVQNENELRIPVLPSAYQVNTAQINTTVNIHELGEINLLGKKRLTTISFTSFFPAKHQSFCDTDISGPIEYIELLEEMQQAGPMKLHITGILCLPVTLESMDYEENDGTGDITYTLNLKEYKYITITEASLSTQQQEQEAAVRETPVPKAGRTHTVISGECLSSIARKETGSANWKPIYEANKEVIGSNPNKIYPGQVLVIP